MEIALEEKTKQLRRGILELAILKILSQNEGYGYNIVAILKANRIQIVEGTVYSILSRLKKEGAITYRWEESDKGPPRKYYFLTSHGRELLTALLMEWVRLTNSLTKIIEGDMGCGECFK